uniref:Uncharacterized protein n=1 Tax=Panagrolaimus davidi TaxID=227884 RepID=A0A914PIZ2_9BILA
MAEHFQSNFGHSIHRENYSGQLASRQSIDMDTSHIESPLIMESCVMFVDEPLEESDDASPPARVPVLVPPIPYVIEPGMYIVPRQTPVKEPLAVTARPDLNAVDEPPSIAQRPPLIAVEKPPLTETVAEKPPPIEIPLFFLKI